MMATEIIANLDEPRDRARVLQMVQTLKGVQRISIVQHRPRRSDRQNKYYWPCFVYPFAQFLRDQGEGITDEEAHEMLKVKFLRRPVYSPSTGEVLGQAVRSTTTLTTAEFNEYLDKCAAWLFDMFHIVVPDPDVYREKEKAA